MKELIFIVFLFCLYICKGQNNIIIDNSLNINLEDKIEGYTINTTSSVCGVGQYLRNSNCYSCLEHCTCANDLIVVDEGYMVFEFSKVLPCINSGCGFKYNATTSKLDPQCTNGTTGDYCNICQRGYLRLENQCVKPSISTIFIYLIACFALPIAVPLFSYLLTFRNIKWFSSTRYAFKLSIVVGFGYYFTSPYLQQSFLPMIPKHFLLGIFNGELMLYLGLPYQYVGATRLFVEFFYVLIILIIYLILFKNHRHSWWHACVAYINVFLVMVPLANMTNFQNFALMLHDPNSISYVGGVYIRTGDYSDIVSIFSVIITTLLSLGIVVWIARLNEYIFDHPELDDVAGYLTHEDSSPGKCNGTQLTMIFLYGVPTCLTIPPNDTIYFSLTVLGLFIFAFIFAWRGFFNGRHKKADYFAFTLSFISLLVTFTSNNTPWTQNSKKVLHLCLLICFVCWYLFCLVDVYEFKSLTVVKYVQERVNSVLNFKSSKESINNKYLFKIDRNIIIPQMINRNKIKFLINLFETTKVEAEMGVQLLLLLNDKNRKKNKPIHLDGSEIFSLEKDIGIAYDSIESTLDRIFRGKYENYDLNLILSLVNILNKPSNLFIEEDQLIENFKLVQKCNFTKYSDKKLFFDTIEKCITLKRLWFDENLIFDKDFYRIDFVWACKAIFFMRIAQMQKYAKSKRLQMFIDYLESIQPTEIIKVDRITKICIFNQTQIGVDYILQNQPFITFNVLHRPLLFLSSLAEITGSPLRGIIPRNHSNMDSKSLQSINQYINNLLVEFNNGAKNTMNISSDEEYLIKNARRNNKRNNSLSMSNTNSSDQNGFFSMASRSSINSSKNDLVVATNDDIEYFNVNYDNEMMDAFTDSETDL
eukprot:TRINITY_DN271_c0_g1_i1.p1 TRINITY_DN271_c0_g1~~TRINITY_DN271_c0_g1_i1.p1  ORF type:complete len:873 (+),score=181.46 TRINITY_DN271_c0_g1_i1:45-2663(+)